MEGGEAPSQKDAEASVDMEKIRQRRLAYFQTATPEKMLTSSSSNKLESDKQRACEGSADSSPLRKDKNRVFVKTSEFHLTVKSKKDDNSLGESNLSGSHVSFPSSKLTQSRPKSDHNIYNEAAREERRSGSSDDHVNQSVRLPHSKHEMNMSPTVSDNSPHFSTLCKTDGDRERWANNSNVKLSSNERTYRTTRKPGDKAVENLFSNRKSTSASAIPALSLQESADIDSLSVFKSKVDFDELGLSTHRPESTTSCSIIDSGEKRKMMKQRSMSSESLLLSTKAEEIRSLLGEEKYKEFLDRSEHELNQLQKAKDSRSASLNWTDANKPDRPNRVDGSVSRKIPTPPPQPPSPQPAGSSKRGPSPRRRLRSSSPQMVSKTLHDIARTKEVREPSVCRNYEQVVIPHNVTFSADEIYRQAYGGDNRSSTDVRKSSVSTGSSYQDTGLPFWSNMTPRQMAGGMSPTSPQMAPMFQPHFMPVSVNGSMHPPAPPQPMPVGSPGTYYFSQTPAAVSMPGGGTGQFVYSHQPNMFMPMSPGASSQSPEAYFYQVHPLSQSMPSYPAPSSPLQSPGGLSWQYGRSAVGQEFQGRGQQAQEPVWNMFGPRVQQNSQHYSQSWQQNHPGLIQTSYLPTTIVGKGVADVDKSKGNKSSAEHADAVRLRHEQQRHEPDKQPYSRSNSQTSGDSSASSVERYFSSLGMLPPSYPPPPYHLHQPPASHQPLSSRHVPNHTFQQVKRQTAETHKSSLPENGAESSDDDDMTTVTKTSLATGTSIKAGGITDRLEQMGVNPIVVQSIKQHSDTVAADEEALEAMRSLVRICPECQAVNKEYMTWCLQCGGVLIGIDPIPAKDLKKKTREKKGNSDFTSKTRKTSSEGNLNGSVSAEAKHSGYQELSEVHKIVPVEVQHDDSQEHSNLSARASLEARNGGILEPLLDFEETIEEQIIHNDSRKEEDQDSSEMGEIPEGTSPVVEAEENDLKVVALDTKESPESGRGASASSSPCRRNIGREHPENSEDPSQHGLEASDNKDSGRPSSGEGAESRKPQISSQLVPEDGLRRSEKEINDICEVINDPIIRGFIKSYLQKKPQDPTPDMRCTQYPAHESSKDRGTVDTTKVSKQQAPKTFSLNLEAGVNRTSSGSNSKPASGRKVDTPKRQKKGVKKGHEAIDVEIFAIEEAKLLRSSRSGANLVPKLNLVHSSDEDDDSSEKTSSLQGAASIGHGASSDTSSPRDDYAPVNYSAEIQTLVATQDRQEENVTSQLSQNPDPGQPSPELAKSNFVFLKDLVENERKTPPARSKKTGHVHQQPQHKPNPTSKVRTSAEAPPPNRHWMRSSIAWSSYHPRELRTRSSLNLQSGGSSRPNRQSTGNFKASHSSDSLVSRAPAPSQMPLNQRPRPASADQHNRRGASRGRPSSAGGGQRPYSAGFYSSLQFCEGARSAAAGDHSASGHPPSGPTAEKKGSQRAHSQDTDIEGRPIHRLALQEDTLPLIPAGPSTALKIYDRCFEKTPRDAVDQECKWLFLPDELWLHVFTFLPQIDLFHIMLTCKQLYRVALDPQLWKRVTVRKKSLRDEWLREIARRHPVSLAMVQCHGDNLSENALRELFRETAPKLKELNFSRCSKGKLIGDEILLHASTYCRHLTHVDASWCHVTDVGLSALAGCCHRLESLCLNGCQQITDESLKTVVERHGTSLRVLELFGCFSLSPASFRNLAEYCTFLLTLSIGQCYKISDSNMVTLSASLSRVETLDLRGCKKLGDNSIRKIVRSCRRLRHLILANCPLLSNSAIVEIATYSTDIRSLDICGCSNISDSSIQTLVNNCFRLTSIDISSTSCSHKSVLMLADSSRCLESAKFNFLPDIHEKSLAKLIRNCKRLNTIHLYGCNVRDVAALKKYNPFLNIEM